MNHSNLVHKREKLYFSLLVAASVLMLILGIVLTVASFGLFLWIIGTIVSLSLFTHWIQIGYIRTNGVKVTARQFTELHEMVQRVGADMGIRLLPDVYILQAGGVLNAFATRFFQKNMVILYSDVVELTRTGQTKEVEFVIAHELAHIRRNHVQKQWVVLLGSIIPFLGSAYSRACEYTCDRMAAHYIQDFGASKRALTVLAIGGPLAKEVNEFDYLYEASRENGFIAKYSELLSTHPTLPKRIASIATAAGEENVPVFKTAGYVKASIISMILLTVIGNGALIAFLFINDDLTEIVSAAMSEELADDWALEWEEPIQELTYNNASYEEIEAELQNGADVNIQDEYGETPLHNLFYNDEVDEETVQLLLDNGADVTLQNDSGMTPIDTARDWGHSSELIALMESYE
ncbi:M48 family metallopeptidase [Exiguobacterium sp. B2(2022)]|uniref:M48 family metallopeptidase n=1 Tax=Exiguobacterium sp. B2(2022) TaxID=2992755 RepID=UPI00237B5F0D|nr:M48 family metallopeptidase [Exiguobacterium sp. B2(2022)]MDE0564396.1 M48 family metalloprotease [Exiguobacterium sp. B2(2022)]